MDHLIGLRKSILNDSIELGYETAHDDSFASLYYSLNNSLDNSLDTNAESLNNSVTSVELCENSLESISSIVAVPVESSSVETNSYIAPNSALPSENESLSYVHPISNSDSSLISTVTSVDNQVDVSIRQVAKSAISTQIRIQIDFSNDNVMEQHSSSATVLKPAISSEIAFSSTALRSHNQMAIKNSKSQRTLARFPTIDEIPQSSKMATSMATQQSGVLSSYNSGRSMIPKSILKKASSVDESKKKTVSLFGISLVRPHEREAIVKKSPPQKSFHVEAGPSYLIPMGNHHTCSICKKVFPLRSKLFIHKMEHKDENFLTNCRYCDRTFKNSVAIATHLKYNCEKIPAAVRKRLLTEDFNKTNKYN